MNTRKRKKERERERVREKEKGGGFEDKKNFYEHLGCSFCHPRSQQLRELNIDMIVTLINVYDNVCVCVCVCEVVKGI